MKIYLDYIFFENLVINLIIIGELTIFIKKNTSKKRIILGSIVISIYTTIVTVIQESFLGYFFIQIFMILIMIYIVYKPQKMIQYFKYSILYFLFFYLYVGTIIAFSLLFHIDLSNYFFKILLYFFSGGILYIFSKYIWKMIKSNIKEDDLIYTLEINGVQLEAFVDTGNQAYDYFNGLDVIFISKSKYNSINQNHFLKQESKLKIKTVSGEQEIIGYVAKNIKVYHSNTFVTVLDKIILSFTLQEIKTTEKYSALIGYNTYIEKLKGVTI